MRKVRVGRPTYEMLRGFWHSNDCTLKNISFCFLNSGMPQKAFKYILSESNSKRNSSKNCELWNHDFINHKANALSSLQYNFIHSNTNWFSSQISSLFAHLPDNNYLTDFMAEWKSLLPCQPFPQSMVVFWWEGRKPLHRVGMHPCLHSAPEHLSVI